MALAVGVSGCASMSGWGDRKPDLVIDTNKSSLAYAQCVAAKWSAVEGATINYGQKPDGKGYIVIMSNEGGKHAAIVNVHVVDGRTVAEAWFRNSGVVNYEKFSAGTFDCD